ncbi:DUF4347 domain-containing protein, partial [Frateuria aurantia]
MNMFKQWLARHRAGDALHIEAAASPLVFALEPRVVYDASVAVAVAQPHGAQADHTEIHGIGEASISRSAQQVHSASAAETSRITTSSLVAAGDRASVDAAPASNDKSVDTKLGAQDSKAGTALENQVVFIDPSVADYQSLIADLPTGTTYVILDANSDGFAQIANYLQTHSGVEAIHLISHGADGQIIAGNAVLDEASLSTYSADLAAIGAAMKSGGDFLIYGCDVAQNADGKALVQDIASLTALNVAASTNDTGATSLGGDWTLEYEVGTVHTQTILNASSAASYDGLLAETVEDFAGHDGYDSGTVLSFTLDGITYTTDVASRTIASTGYPTNNLADESANEVGLGFDIDIVGISSVTITMADGSAFNLSSIDIDAIADTNVTITANGSSTGEVVYSSNGQELTETVSTASNSAFQNVTSVTISGSNLVLDLAHIVYEKVAPAQTLTTTTGATSFLSSDETVTGSTAAAVAVDSGITYTDTESSTAVSATVKISSGYVSGQDTLSFVDTDPTTYGDILASWDSSTGVLTLTAESSVTTAQWQAVLQAVTYQNTAQVPDSGTRTVTFSVNDGTASVTATRSVTVTATDQTPVVSTSSGSTSYSSAGSTVVVDSGVSASDADNTTLLSATVAIGSGFESGDTLTYTQTSGDGNITASYDASSGVMTLSSSDQSATLAEWSAALSSIGFTTTNGTAGTRVIDYVVNDGQKTSAGASKSVVVSLSVSIVTDSGSASLVAGDNEASTPVTVSPNLTVTDTTASTATVATVSISGNFVAGEDVLSFTNDGVTMGDITASYDATTGVMTLTASGSATIAQWQSALRAVTYTDTAITPTSSTRTVSISLTDSSSNASNTATRTITVTDTDQTPIVSTSNGASSYTSGGSAAAIDSSVTVSDLDNATLSSATVSIGSGFASGDVLTFISGVYGNIVGSYNSTTGVLTLSSSNSTASLAQWQAALESITYSTTSNTSGTRTIDFTVSDGAKTSAVATKDVSVTVLASVTTDSGSASFVAGDNTASTPVVVDAGLTLSSSQSTASTATVAITGNFSAGEDVLLFTNDGVTMGNISASYNAATGVMTLGSSGGTATIAQWQAALRSVSYTDTAVTPYSATRTISFSLTDSEASSLLATRTVTITDTDQTPILTTSSGTTAYISGASAATVDSGVTVSDLDNSTLSSAVVSIGSGFSTGDTLNFTNDGVTMGDIVASYNATTGVLTLVSGSGTATLAQWQSALDSVAFSTTNGSSATRTVDYVVSDGTKTSAAATKDVAVSAPPTVTTDSGSASFVAGDNTASTPVVVDAGLTLSSSQSTITSATVLISGNFSAGEDVLSFTNDGLTMGDINASYNAATGVLTLQSYSGTATIAQWQAALRSVSYTDTAVTPSNATRTVSFSATDVIGTSVSSTRTVTITDTDQTPILTTSSGATSYTNGAAATTVDSSVTVSDLDNSTLTSAVVSIASGFQSGDILSFTGSAIYGNIVSSYNTSTGVLTLVSLNSTATLAQWQAALESITFLTTSASSGTRTVDFSVSDGAKTSVAATKDIAVSILPTVTTDSGSVSFVAADNSASTPVTVDAGLTLSSTQANADVATVSITGNFSIGEDVLSFTNDGVTMGDITGSYNAVTGVLTLTASGGATIAQWQAALRSVTYTDVMVTPNDATRTISFALTDAVGTSATSTRTITVTDTDQTPILTTSSGTTSFVAADNGVSTAVAVDGGLSLSDLDSTHFESATISITGNFASSDVLSFTPNSSLYSDIVASYNASTGVLTLTSGGAATTAQWQAALRSVTYTNTQVTPSSASRTISFSISDGSKISETATRTVTVTDTDQTPQVSSSSTGSATFVAGDNTASTPVTVDSGLTLSDLDNATLASATVQIGAGFQAG